MSRKIKLVCVSEPACFIFLSPLPFLLCCFVWSKNIYFGEEEKMKKRVSSMIIIITSVEDIV